MSAPRLVVFDFDHTLYDGDSGGHLVKWLLTRSPLRAVAGRLPVLGVNNRDLRTFDVSLDTSIALKAMLPPGRLLVSESGIAAPADVQRLRAAGIGAFLVGEAFMRESEPGAALRRLFSGGAAAGAAAGAA